MACLGGRANLGSRPRTLVELPCHLTRSTPRLLPVRKEKSSDAQRRRREAPAHRGERSLRAKARRSLSSRERSPGADEPEGRNPSEAGEATVWSGKRGSNPRHPPWQGGALPLSYSRSGARRIAEGSAAVKLRECLERYHRSAGTRGGSRRRTSSREHIFRREAVRSHGSGRRRPSRCESGSRQVAGPPGPWPG